MRHLILALTLIITPAMALAYERISDQQSFVALISGKNPVQPALWGQSERLSKRQHRRQGLGGGHHGQLGMGQWILLSGHDMGRQFRRLQLPTGRSPRRQRIAVHIRPRHR